MSLVLGMDLLEMIRQLSHIVLDLLVLPFPLIHPPLHQVSSARVLDFKVLLSPSLSINDLPIFLVLDDGWDSIKPSAPIVGYELAWVHVWCPNSLSPMDVF